MNVLLNVHGLSSNCKMVQDRKQDSEKRIFFLASTLYIMWEELEKFQVWFQEYTVLLAITAGGHVRNFEN